jgi:hypothetical protein
VSRAQKKEKVGRKKIEKGEEREVAKVIARGRKRESFWAEKRKRKIQYDIFPNLSVMWIKHVFVILVFGNCFRKKLPDTFSNEKTQSRFLVFIFKNYF